MSAKDELLKVLLNEILKADEAEEGKEKDGETPKQKTEAEIRAEVEAELMEKAKAAAAEAAAKAKADAEKDKEDEEENPEEDSDDETLSKQVRESINDKVKLGFSGKNIDFENFQEINKFLDYGTLKGEDGLADGEKINDFVDSIASIALRQPPKSKDKQTFDPSAQGLAKYLK